MKVKMLTASAALAAVLCFNAKNAQAAENNNQDSTANKQSNETQANLKTSKANLEFRVQHLKETNGSKKAIDKLNDQIDRLDKRIIKKQKEEKKEETKPVENKPEQKPEVKQEEKKEAPKAVNNVLSVTQNTPVQNTPVTQPPASPAVQQQKQNVPVVQQTANSSARDTLVSKAKSLLGIPYVWGGTNPSSGLDCSGLTSFCYSQIGINIGRTTYNQDTTGRHISLNDLKPGDLILEYGKGHIAMYIGNGQQIEAPQPGESVKISPVPYAYGAMYGLSYVD